LGGQLIREMIAMVKKRVIMLLGRSGMFEKCRPGRVTVVVGLFRVPGAGFPNPGVQNLSMLTGPLAGQGPPGAPQFYK